MEEIYAASEQALHDHIKSIDEIACQINPPALKAAVEMVLALLLCGELRSR